MAGESSQPIAARVMTREQLYAAVWTTPMSRLADDWGLSRSGLAKLCDRLLIPYPGRGHWAGHGPDAEPPPLPEAPPGSPVEIALGAGSRGGRRERTRLPAEARRRLMLDAAAAVIAREGLHAASLKRIARDTGMSEAQAHNLFAGRADLLVALARRELAEMNEIRLTEIERGRGSLERVTLSTLAYLRQVDRRGALVQRLLNSREVRAGLQAEREERSRSERRRVTDRLEGRYAVPRDIGHAATVVLTAVCLRAGRLLAEGKIDLALAERLSVTIVNAGNRSITARAREAGERPARPGRRQRAGASDRSRPHGRSHRRGRDGRLPPESWS
jgi:AcrR family transcriptional regulator